MITAFELIAKLGLNKDEYNKGLKNAEDEGKSTSSKIGGLMGGVAKAGFTALTAAIGTATTATVALGKVAFDEYKNYEQLVGGMQKLYGDATDKMMQYANQAYMTSNMSANQYMETATSFSAALINSLGGDVEAAADKTDVAMRAISDNVNMFGSDMESVSNAFQGFAKQNYMMLDNLKLGYAGSSAGMKQLIADANEYAVSIGQAGDLSMDSFADIVTAVDLIQQKQNIAGTTIKESLKTIEGSLNATKASWTNVLTAIAGGGDLQQAMDGLITSVFGDGSEGSGLMAQIIPRIQTIMEGIGKFMEKASPYIEKYLPPLIRDLLKAVGPAISTMLDVLAPALKDVAVEIFSVLKDALKDNFPELYDTIKEIVDIFEKLELIGGILLGIFASVEIVSGITTMITAFQTFAGLFASGGAVATALGAIGNLFTVVIGPAIAGFVTTAATLVAPFLPFIAIAAAVVAAGVLIYQNWDTIKEKVGELKENISEKWDNIKEKAGELKDSITEKWNEISQNISNKWEEVKTNTNAKWKGIKDKVDEHGGGIKGILGTYTDWYKDKWIEAFGKINEETRGKLGEAYKTVSDKLGNIGDKFIEIKDAALTWGKDMIGNFIKGIEDKWNELKDAAVGTAKKIKDVLHFSEPDEGPLSDFHTYAPDMMNLFMQGIKDNQDKLQNTVMDAFNFQDLITSPSINAKSNGVVGGNANVTLNIYGAEGQDVRELADIISERINNVTNRKLVSVGVV